MNVILCGLPMSGKTTIGQMLAEALGRPFIDTDRCIERAYRQHGRSCRQIFLTEGELFFRELERDQIASLSAAATSVIAVGGGALCSRVNADALRAAGLLIYLKAPIDTLWHRLKSRELPPYLNRSDPEESFYELAHQRIPIYENSAHWTVDTHNRSTLEIVNQILDNYP